MNFDDVIRHCLDFYATGVSCCADFEFGISLSFICVEMGSLGSNTPKMTIFAILILTPKMVRRGPKGIA